MPPRRSHRKSRLGCLQCKRRKIKCDERPPPCGNCKKHNIECQFAPATENTATPPAPAPTPPPVIGSSANIPSSTPTQAFGVPRSVSTSNYFPSAPISIAALTTPPTPAEQHDIFDSFVNRDSQFTSDLNLDDLELFHHYTTQTYQTLSNNNEHEEIWKTAIPKEALAHPFLMHGLLALAALHLIECSGSDNSMARRKYTELATRHQNLALAAFRPQLNNITPSNCHAVFAFSTLIAALAFAFTRSVGNTRTGEPISQMLQDFFLFRGVEGVLTAFWEIILKGKLGALVRRSSDPSSSQPLSKDVINALDYLHDCNGDNVPHISRVEKIAYHHAIRELRISFERSPSSWENVFRWPIVLPEAYLAFLKSRKPMALVILAHYCVILSKLDLCWWCEGWSRHLFEAIYRALDVTWRPLVQWPMQMMRLTEMLANIP